MLLRETGFSFGGIHSRSDMGLLYAEKDGHTIIPRIKRNTYEIAGVSGTVLLDGEQWETISFEGTLYPAIERVSQAEAQLMLRNVAAWLTAGRQRLIFDYEPDKYYMAELSAASVWSLKNWFGGELPIKFEAQPFAYNLAENSATNTTTGSAVTVTVNVSTGQQAPLKLQVKNVGSAPITGVQVGSTIVLSGMNLKSGQTLVISMEPPSGAAIAGANALPYAEAFSPMLLTGGVNHVHVLLTYGSGTGGAQVTVSARGRW